MNRKRLDPVSLMISPGVFVFLFGMLILIDAYPDLGVAAIFVPFFTWWGAVVIAVTRTEPHYKRWRIHIKHEDSEIDAESIKVRGYSPRYNRLLKGLKQ